MNSFFSDPQFLTPTGTAATVDLHINPAVTTFIEGNGILISPPTDDFDGQTRSTLTPVDIGADAGNFMGVDLTPPVIAYTALGNTTSTANRTLTISVTDTGSGVPIAGVGLPVLYYRKPSGGYVGSQCVFVSGSSYTCVFDYTPIAPVTTGDSIQYYVVAQDNAATPNVTSNPAGGPYTANPPASAPMASPNSYSIVAAIPTSLTVNSGGGGSATSLTNAGGIFSILNSGALTGNTTVNIETDLLAETGTISLNQLSEDTGGPFTVTFQASGSAHVISGSNTTALINLNGADRITFSGNAFGGQSLLFRNTSATTGAVFQLTNDASSNLITTCTIEGQNSNTSSALVLLATGTTTGNDSNVISGNIIRDRTDAVGVPVNIIASLNGSATALNSNNTISNNKLMNFINNGFATSTGATSNNWTITGNEVTENAAQAGNTFAFNTGGMTGTNTISGNSIHGLTSTGTNAILGFLVGNSLGLTISNNRIYDFQTTAGATGVIEGMEFDGGSGTTANVIVTNNFISLAPTLTTAQAVIGIQDFAFGGNVFTADHNTVYIGGTSTNTVSWAIKRGNLAPTTYTARNNIAFNNRSGGTAASYAGGDDSANTGTFVSNGNFFAGTGATATPASFMDYGSTSTGTPVTFAAWQAGPPTRDANSNGAVASAFTLANIFVNAAAADLHLLPGAGGNFISSGLPLASVTTDIDGDPRPASPDRGADELVQAESGLIPAGTFYNVSATSGDTLGGNVTVTNAFYLGGIFNTSTFTLTINCAAAVSGASPSSYVNGNLQKQYCGPSVKGFEVGTANGYSPVSANVTGGTFPSTLTVKAVEGPQPNVPAGTSLQRYWTLTEGGTLTANLNFNYLDPLDIMGTEANYKLIRVESGTPFYFPNTCPALVAGDACVDFVGNQATIIGVTDFSDWTLGEIVNATPTISSDTIARQAGTTTGINSTIATVADTDTAVGTLGVTVTSANPSNGVTVSNIVNIGGTITADVVADCVSSNATFTLQVSDGSTTSTGTLTVNVSANTAPTAAAYNNVSVNVGASGSNTPTLAATDNGAFTYQVFDKGGYTGTVTVDPSTGIVSIPTAIGPAGSFIITIRAKDACGLTTDSTFTLTISTANVTVAGSTGADGGYATLKDAFDALNLNATQTANVITVTINGDTTETAPAVLNAPTSNWTSLTISPSGARTVSGNLAAPLVDLNGADKVTIDGLNTGGNSLTLSNASTAATAGTSTIRLINGATQNTITKSSILGSSTGTVAAATGNVLISTTAAAGNNSNIISTNAIGPVGTNLPTKGVMGLGTAGQSNISNIVSGNNIFDFFSPTISVSGVSIQANNAFWIVSNNHIYQTAPRVFTGATVRYAGITLNFADGTTGVGGNFTVTGNTIGFGAANGTGTTTISGLANEFRGIDAPAVDFTTPTSIQNNTISGINQTTSRSSTALAVNGFIGIQLGDLVGGLFNVGNTTGNKIGSLDGSSSIVINATSTTANTSREVGIFDWSGGDDNISKNQMGTITINSGGTGTRVGFDGIQVISSPGQSMVVSNNIIGGTAAGSITDNQTGSYLMQGIAQPFLFIGGSGQMTATGNVIRNMTSFGGAAGAITMRGIALTGSQSPDVNVVSQNTVHSLVNNSGTFATSIYAIDVAFPTTANVVERNFIHSNVVNSTSTTAQVWGIIMRGGTVASSGAAGPGGATFKNNMIRLGLDAAGGSITTPYSIIGIRDIVGAGNNSSFYSNTVYIGGSGVTAGGSNTYGLFSDTVTTARNFQNNILWNARSNAVAGGTAQAAIFLAGTTPNPAGTTSNFNDLFASGTDGAVGVYNSTVQTTLANWRTATGQDANSMSVDPLLIAPTGTAATVNLHLVDDTGPASNSGTPIGAVTNDFDNDPRSATLPDIGADEVASTGTAGVLALSSATYTVGEAGGTATITVNRTGGSIGAVAVSYALTDGTATGGAACGGTVDFVNTGGTVNFANGQTSKTFTVAICNDVAVEGNETFNVTLSGPTGGATLGAQASAVVTITDDEVAQPGTLALSSGTYSIGEAGGTVTITVNRTGGTDGAVAVNYALSNGTATGGAACGAGVDFVNTGGTVNFINGQASNTFTVAICNDAVFEGNEDFTVTLSGPTGGATLGAQTSAVVTITDDEVAQPGALALSSATYNIGEAGGTVTITVNRTGGTDGAVAVNYALTDGSATGGAACGGAVDYVNTGGTVNFINGQASNTFTVAICNDVAVEGNENFNVTLSGPTGGATLGAQTSAVVTITDDDTAAAPSVNFSAASYIEDESQQATITIKRTGDLSQISTVTFTATPNGSTTTAAACGAGVDYAVVGGSSQVVTFPATIGSQNVLIDVCPDMVVGETDSVSLTLGAPSSNATIVSPSAVTLTLNDSATQFRQSAAITMTTTGATPYPSILSVSGLPTSNGGFRVTLFDVSQQVPDNMDVLLVDPTGKTYVLMADAGGVLPPIDPSAPVTLTFTDNSSTVLPDSNPPGLTTGVYLPTTWTSNISSFPAGAPVAPYMEPGSAVSRPGKTLFDRFGGLDPNGDWKLYVRDDQTIDPITNSPAVLTGAIAGGWGLQFFAPTAAGVSVSGRVRTAGGDGIAGARVTITDGHGIIRTALTNAFGYYTFYGVSAGEGYVMGVSAKRYLFTPRLLQVFDNVSDEDFTPQ
ncbi:MAG TPA: Calx-beta domain-containing protein [Pyrinomonadaceae bacterium]|nr:Calx-beta domain-containing protein [Pyrinomonadaceae bacterium]